MGWLRIAVLVVPLACGCGARSGFGQAAGASATGPTSTASSTGTGGSPSSTSASTGGTGGSMTAPLCPDDVCTPAGCMPVLLYAFDPFTEGELVAEAPRVCVSSNTNGATEYDCFDRCGGAPFMTATDDGYPSGLLLDSGALTSAVGESGPKPFVQVVRRDLGSMTPAASSPVWESGQPYQLENLARAGDSLYFSFTTSDQIQLQGIYRMPYAGGAPTLLSNWRVEPEPHTMVVSSGVAYLSSDDPSHYGIASFALGMQAAPALLYPEKPPISGVAGLAVTNGRIVWADVVVGNGSNESWIRSMSEDGTGKQVLAHVPSYVMGVAADADAIYFTTEGSSGMGLSWIPLAGGAPTSLVSGEMRVDRLTQDADYLFYIGHDGVYRVRKPGA